MNKFEKIEVQSFLDVAIILGLTLCILSFVVFWGYFISYPLTQWVMSFRNVKFPDLSFLSYTKFAFISMLAHSPVNATQAFMEWKGPSKYRIIFYALIFVSSFFLYNHVFVPLANYHQLNIPHLDSLSYVWFWIPLFVLKSATLSIKYFVKKKKEAQK